MAKALGLIYLAWGVNWVFMKLGNDYFPPISFVTWRFSIGAIVLLCVWRYLRLPLPSRRSLAWIALTGFLQITLNNIALQYSMLTLGSGMVAVLNYSMPIYVSIMAHFALGEKLTPRKGAGIMLAVAGVAMLMGVQGLGDLNAMFIAICGSVLWATATIIMRLKLKDVDAISFTTWQMTIVAISLQIFTTLVPQGEITLNRDSILCIAYNGVIASALAFFLWTWLLQRMEAAKASVAVLGVPVVGVISGVIILGEPLTATIIGGMLLVMLGIYVVVSAKSPVKAVEARPVKQS